MPPVTPRTPVALREPPQPPIGAWCVRRLARRALELEEKNRWEPRAARTIELVVDDTPWPLYPRVRLDVSAEYSDFEEQMCFYGNGTAKGWQERGRRSRPIVRFATWYEGNRIPLLAEQAALLIDTNTLPVRREEGFPLGDPFVGLIDAAPGVKLR